MKKLLSLTMLLVVSMQSFSQSQGPLLPDAATYSASGCLACPGSEWADILNLRQPDHQYTKAFLADFGTCFQTTCYYSRDLYTYDFDFSIPAGALITGVKSEVIYMASIQASIVDSVVQLYTGSPVGTNHAQQIYWPTLPSVATYGGSNDTWGYPLTPDTVNSSLFGTTIIVKNKNMNAYISASIDQVQMTVYYTLGTGIFSQTRSSQEMNVYYNTQLNTLSIFSDDEAVGELHLFEVTGKKILALSGIKTQKGMNEILLPELEAGIYAAVLSGGTRTFTKKICIVN